MREIQASDAKARLAQLLAEVERGETVVITRHGRPIARLVPEPQGREAHVQRVLDELEAFRRTMPAMTLDDLLSARHRGHRV